MKVIAANSSHAMIPYAGTCILTSSKMLLFFIIGWYKRLSDIKGSGMGRKCWFDGSGF